MAAWADKDRETAKTMWAEGYSASEIARFLGGVTRNLTRNAVIGVLHRMGLSAHDGGQRSAARHATPKNATEVAERIKARKLPPRLPPRVAQTPIAVRRAAIEAELPATDDLMSARGCRWPIGDPLDIATGGFRYCQREKEHGPYCDIHREVSCGVPSKPRAPRTRSSARMGDWQ